MHTRKLLIAALGLTLAAGGATTALAQSDFAQTHPARDQVNDRLTRQNQRIHRERREGEMSAAQAHRLHMADRRIRQHERRFARNHGGHITRAEQHRLNRQENQVSSRIGQ
jgi:hypothetical protein